MNKNLFTLHYYPTKYNVWSWRITTNSSYRISATSYTKIWDQVQKQINKIKSAKMVMNYGWINQEWYLFSFRPSHCQQPWCSYDRVSRPAPLLFPHLIDNQEFKAHNLVAINTVTALMLHLVFMYIDCNV